MDAGRLDLVLQIADQVPHHTIEDPFHCFVELQLLHGLGVGALGIAIKTVKSGNPSANLLKGEQAGLIAVVEIGCVVRDFVGQIDELRLQRRALIEQIFRQLGKLFDRVIVRVLDDAFAYFESKVEPAEGGIAQLKVFDDAQGMQVMVEEKSVLAHDGVQRFFAGVSERWVTDVVDQGQSFD